MLSFVPLGFTVVVEGFVPLSTPGVTAMNQHRSNNVQYFHQAFGRLSASQQDGNSNQGEGEGDPKEAIDTSTTVSGEESLDDDYDFEAGFQARLKKEGGRTGVQVKAAKRSVDSAARAVTSGLKQQPKKQNSVDLLSLSEWNLTLGFLALVVVLAVGTHFASPAPFETSSTGEQLGFGGR